MLDMVRQLYCTFSDPQAARVVTKLNSNAKAAEYVLDHARAALTVDRWFFNSDRTAHLLPFRNVTVDLRTGKTMPHDPRHCLTGCMQADYNPDADLGRVKEAFARFWPGDDDTAEQFQVALGYSATGEVAAKRMFLMVGDQVRADSNGDNGKSMVQGALTRLFGFERGGFGVGAKPQLIIDVGDRDANSHDAAKGVLIWKRFAMASEFRVGASVNSGEFNVLSGGDVIGARPPHSQDTIQFINRASMWFSMNTPPRFKTWDQATKRRLTPFPFTQTFHNPGCAPAGGQEKDLSLKPWLESKAGQEALGAYLVEGAMKYYALNNGSAGDFPDSAAVCQMREKILAQSNPYHDFFEEFLVFDATMDTLVSAMNSVLNRPLKKAASTRV
ncbi:hypothetical protein DLJ49_21205 [Rhodovulum sp. 12E13]|uniref:hypothetical protein n=1 Tax=Rhodovulum sp. 12E13 TaxID=2203891 RepID=UPI000E1340D5|nr:hypothetical protein [Rhodovulum sp. 12E13]RDC67248.1 hypothetical protein DLJ49_21205 [Rhodovulum sp. 12E13]